ncbi:unnamed protein product, partial [Rotaria sp. Silwood2]
ARDFLSYEQLSYNIILISIQIFAVFRTLINAHYSSQVNEWSLLSMTSSAQRKLIRMAKWELTGLMLNAYSLHTT